MEQQFSHGHLLLTHVHSRLSDQSTRALLCLSYWSLLDLVRSKDVESVTKLPNVQGDEEELEKGWDTLSTGHLDGEM